MDVREKGHRFERFVVKLFKQLGFKNTTTTRNSSKLLDSCKVDIDNIPFYIQCKHGYERGINYTTIFRQMKDSLLKTYGKVKYPLVIMHKKSNAYEENLVIIPLKDFYKLLTKIYNVEIEENEMIKETNDTTKRKSK